MTRLSAPSASASVAGRTASSKVVHLMRHGTTNMNMFLRSNPYGSATFEDPMDFDTRLTERGRQGAKDAAAKARRLAPAPELLVVSPLSRAIETALLAFPHHQGPVLLEPLARERVWLSSDMGRPPHELRQEFLPQVSEVGWQGIDFGGMTEEVWWYTGPDGDPRRPHLEPEEVFASRVADFKAWLGARPESSIAVVAHWGLIHELTGGSSFENCEVRSYELCSRGRLRPVPSLGATLASAAPSWLSSLLPNRS